MQPGEGTEDTKRRVSYRELLPEDPARAAAVRRLVQTLADRDARLITTEGTDASDGAVEVAHEALIRGWTQLRRWIEAERAGLRTQRRLTEAAQEWAVADPEHKEDYLYSGARLAVSREWAAAHRDELSAIEAAFLSASEEAERQREQDELENERRLREAAEAAQAAERKRADHEAEASRRLRRRLWAMIGATAATVVAAGLAIYLWDDAKDQRILADQRAVAAQKAEAKEKAQRIIAERETKRALAQERIAESRRLAVLSDSVRPQRLDLAMLLAVEASEEDTLEARGCLQRALDARPEISHFLHVPEGRVTSVAFGPEGRLAAGYGVGGVGGGGVVLFDARGERLRPRRWRSRRAVSASVAFGPEGRLAAGYAASAAVGGVVLFDARGSGSARRRWRSRRAVSRAWPSARRAASPQDIDVGGGVGGVVLFDARGERLRPAPLEVKEGGVTSVAFGPEGRLAAGYRRRRRRRRRGALRRAGGAAPPGAAGGQGGRRHERGLRPGGPPRRGYGVGERRRRRGALRRAGERLRPRRWRSRRAASRAWPSARRAASPQDTASSAVGVGGVVLFDARGSGSAAPLEVKEGGVTSVAFGPEGRLAAGYGVVGGVGVGGVVLFDARGAAPPAPLEVKEGGVTSVAFGPEGRLAAGYGGVGVGGGGVVLFDARAERLRPAPLEVRRARHERGLRPGGPPRRGIWRRRRRRRRGALRRAGGAAPPAPLEVKEGGVTSVAFGPEGRLAAGYGGGVVGVGGVVLFDARGERLRPAPLEVKEGVVTSVAFGPEGRLAAGYGGVGGGGGVVLFDARGERLRPRRWRSRRAASGAWPSARRAASPRDMRRRRRRRRRGALRRAGGAAPPGAAGGQGGRCQRAWPSARRAASPQDIARRRRRRRRGALRRAGGAAPARAAGGQGGRCHERGLRPGGPPRRRIWRRRRRRRRGALRR